MRSCCTRSTNLYGPAQTGFGPNLSPASFAAFGDTIMPARSVSCGEQRRERRLQVQPHGRAGRRPRPCRPRRARACGTSPAWSGDARGEYLTASASNVSPSWNFTLGPQLDRDRPCRRPRSRGERELRHDVQLLVDVEQLVAERGEDDAADIGARQRRIEHVGILGQADAQRRSAAIARRDRSRRAPRSDERRECSVS